MFSYCVSKRLCAFETVELTLVPLVAVAVSDWAVLVMVSRLMSFAQEGCWLRQAQHSWHSGGRRGGVNRGVARSALI
jgi:hypothetical protein